VTIAVSPVNDAPSAALVATPLSGDAPLTVSLDASSSTDIDGDAIQSYTFNFGDGTPNITQASPQVSHVYTSAGNFTASVTATDPNGAASSNSAQAAIQVREAAVNETIEDTDSRIAYSSAWHLQNHTQSSAGHFRYHTGKSPSHSAKLDFFVPAGKTGAITYYFGRSTNGGTADVYLDGVKKATVNYKGANGSTKAPEISNAFSLSYGGLQPGAHTLEIANLDGVVYLDRFVLQSSGSTATPAAAPGETETQSSTAGGSNSAETSYQAPANSQSMTIFTESSVNLPYQLVLIDPQGLALTTVNASKGMATIELPVSQGGTYVIKVVNVNLGPLQFTTTVTPLVKR
jgi:PKD repeat protein